MSFNIKWLHPQQGPYWLLIAWCLIFLLPDRTLADEKDRVAILPFGVHTVKPMEYLRTDLQKRLTDILSRKGLNLISPDVINAHPQTALPVLETEDILALGADLEARWVVRGSLTLIGERVSLDLRLIDTTGVRPPSSIFMVEDNLDRLDTALDRSAESIHNQVIGVIQIDSVLVTGNRRVESEAILHVIDSKRGDRFSHEQLNEDLRTIYRMGYFTDVSLETEDGPKGKIVIFHVTEKPSIGSISFSGNRKKRDKELLNTIGIRQYAILNMDEIRQSVNRLRELYHEAGYYQVSIQERVEDLPQNEVALVYEIDEGPKMYITEIEFKGNNHFSDRQLRRVMETKEKSLLSWFTKAGVLDHRRIEYDRHKITIFYNNHGFIRARVGEPQIAFEGEKGITITLEIEEGPRFRVGAVKAEGDLLWSQEELLARVNIDNEDYFNLEIIRQDILKLKNLYADQGYAYAEVTPLTQEDDEKQLVDIIFHLDQRKRVRIERINIYGNTKTRDKVIRRELQIIEGEYYSGSAIQKSVRNLNRLAFFDPVEVQTREGTSDDLLNLDINVKEMQTGSFSIGVGYSTYESAMAILQVQQNNLFGRGQSLAANIKASGKSNEFNIHFTEPWLFDRRLSLGTNLYKWKTEYTEYTKDSLGGKLLLSFPTGLDEFTWASIGYGYDRSDISDVADTAAWVIRDMIGQNVTSSLILGLKRDSRDRILNTSSGSHNSFSFEYAGGPLGGDSYFNKYIVQSDWYFPFKWETVFVIRGRIGLAEERSGGVLPVFEKFFLGGIDTVRGYDYLSISPRDPATRDKIGGEKMWIYNLEYRFPLFKDQGVFGVVFFDAGNVFSKDEDFAFRGKRSIGAGFRWYSPMGPIRVEYGYRLDKVVDDDRKGGWEFTMGGFF